MQIKSLLNLKPLLPILVWFWPCLAIAQAKGVSSVVVKDTSKTSHHSFEKAQAKPAQDYKPEIFTSGFIDIINNGQVNASARFIRFFIGEPDKFI